MPRAFFLLAMLWGAFASPALADEPMKAPTPEAVTAAAVEGLKKANALPQEVVFSCTSLQKPSLSTAVLVYGICHEKGSPHILLLNTVQEGLLTPPEGGGIIAGEILKGASVDVLIHDSPERKATLLGRLTIGYRYGTKM